MEGLRNFIEVDNHSALPSEGRYTEFCGTKAKVRREVPRGVNQGRSRVIDAQHRRSWLQKNVHQCRSHCGGQGRTAFGGCCLACLLLYKGIEAETGRELFARALWKMKAAKDR